MKQKKIILLAGPTASGKSKLALLLAKHFNGEIINADSMQVYKEISILTSKPNEKDIKSIKHHLYGFKSVKNFFSTGDWLKMSLKKIHEQFKNKKTPIVVGGTGLYFKALTDGLVKIPEIPKDLRADIRNYHKRIGQKMFFKKLISLDPLSKKFVSIMDPQRSIRAYEVFRFTKKSFFSFKSDTKLNFEKTIFKKIFINFPRDLLVKKIEQRVDKMFNDGALEEVENFFKMKIDKDLSANKIIGIREIRDYLNGNTNLIKTKQLITQKTRQYAKRQFTWARGHMRSWKMLYSPNINELFKKTINKIS